MLHTCFLLHLSGFCRCNYGMIIKKGTVENGGREINNLRRVGDGLLFETVALSAISFEVLFMFSRVALVIEMILII